MIYKFGYVLIPRASADGTSKLRNWDLWGPFFICLIFGLFINSTPFIKIDSSQFVLLFFTVFGGGMVVTFNTRVLGGQISFFQSVAILGYCIFPLFIAVFVLELLKFIQFTNTLIKLLMIVVTCLWSILCKFVYIFSCESLCISQCKLR